MNKIVLPTIIYLALTFLIFTPKVIASDYSLSITPPLLRVHIKPGKSISQVFTINNQSQSDKTLVARIIPFTKADNLGNPVLNPKSTAPWLNYFSLANSKIKLNEPFNLPAGSTEQIVLSFSVPNTAPLEDIYATLMVSTYTNSLNKDLQGTIVTATIGSNMLITVSSTAYPDTILKIESFSPQAGSLIKIGNLYFADSLTPLTFTAKVLNIGKFSAETKGVFRVSSSNGTPIYLEGLLPINVISQSERQLLNSNGQPFTFSPSLGQIGTHQISIEIKTDNSSTTNSITVFFFPLKLSLGLIIAIFIVVIISRIASISIKHSTDIQQPR
ncbi:MAG TPA: hypothetical protein PLI45_04835 [Candidatus Woesebacteria bacterium]|nr:hypothetical protein [Candidatus Woesebacteria bacterium]